MNTGLIDSYSLMSLWRLSAEIKKIMDKQNFVLKRSHLPLIRERIRACSDTELMTVNKDDPFG